VLTLATQTNKGEDYRYESSHSETVNLAVDNAGNPAIWNIPKNWCESSRSETVNLAIENLSKKLGI